MQLIHQNNDCLHDGNRGGRHRKRDIGMVSKGGKRKATGYTSYVITTIVVGATISGEAESLSVEVGNVE